MGNQAVGQLITMGTMRVALCMVLCAVATQALSGDGQDVELKSLVTEVENDDKDAVGEGVEEKPFDKTSKKIQSLANPKIYQAAAKGEVSAVKKHLKGPLKAVPKALIAAAVAAAKKASDLKKIKAGKLTFNQKLVQKQKRLEAKVQCQSMKEENAALATGKELLTYTNGKLKIDKKELENQATVLQGENGHLRRQVRSLKIASAKEGKLFSGNMKLVEDNTRLAKGNDKLRKKVRKIRTAEANAQIKILKQKTEIAKMQHQVTQMKLQLATKDKQIQGLMDAAVKQKAAHGVTKKSLSDTRASLAAEKATVAAQKKVIAKGKMDLKAQKDVSAKLSGTIDHGKVVKRSLEERNRVLQVKVAGLVSGLRQAKAKNVKLAKTEAALLALQVKYNNSSAERKAAAAKAAADAAKKVVEKKKAVAVAKSIKKVNNKLLSAKLLPAKKGDKIKDGVKASNVANIFKAKVKIAVKTKAKAKPKAEEEERQEDDDEEEEMDTLGDAHGPEQ